MLTATRPKDRVWLRINGRSRMNSLSRCKAPSVPHGTAFTEEERTKLGLQNLLSTHVNRTGEQAAHTCKSVIPSYSPGQREKQTNCAHASSVRRGSARPAHSYSGIMKA